MSLPEIQITVENSWNKFYNDTGWILIRDTIEFYKNIVEHAKLLSHRQVTHKDTGHEEMSKWKLFKLVTVSIGSSLILRWCV